MTDREQHELHDLFLLYKDSVVPVEIVTADGDQGIGTAFHVGDGAFVTARHVVDRARSVTVLGRKIEDRKFHEKPDVDVAVFQIPDEAARAFACLGSHFDDWINDDDFVLSRAVVLGYPPIPMTNEPCLSAVTAEVNAVIGVRGTRYVHFVMSAMARGGFSGGPVISEWNFILGMTTASLVWNAAPEQLGHFTIIGIEPIYECLHRHGMLPPSQREGLMAFGDDDEVLP